MWEGEGAWAHGGANKPLPGPPEETPPGGQHADSWGPLGSANWLAVGVRSGPILGLLTREARGSRQGVSRRLAPKGLDLSAGGGNQREETLSYFFCFSFSLPLKVNRSSIHVQKVSSRGMLPFGSVSLLKDDVELRTKCFAPPCSRKEVCLVGPSLGIPAVRQ